MKKNKRRLHPLEIVTKNASFDILGYLTKRYREALNRKNAMSDQATCPLDSPNK